MAYPHILSLLTEGDGVGQDITPVMRSVVDSAVYHAYHDEKKIHWMEVFNGEKAAVLYDGDAGFPRNLAPLDNTK